MSAFLGRRRVVAATILVLVAVVATESVVIAATTVRQGSVEYMKVATTTDGIYSDTIAWTDVPGTALAMPIPSGEHDFIQISFAVGVVACYRITVAALMGECSVRALVDGLEVSPGPIPFGDSHNNAQNLAHSMQWVSNVLAPGTHYVKIQFRPMETNNSMGLFARTATVIRAKAY